MLELRDPMDESRSLVIFGFGLFHVDVLHSLDGFFFVPESLESR